MRRKQAAIMPKPAATKSSSFPHVFTANVYFNMVYMCKNIFHKSSVIGKCMHKLSPRSVSVYVPLTGRAWGMCVSEDISVSTLSEDSTWASLGHASITPAFSQ